ncbi:MAG TPA: hypothetical protein ENO29_07735 [Candidatus Aminicenantes bacterium]|nr:MAG: hypothetical protein C0168_01920 [Candidatus Aminicenantes bacterium]HEK86225.1 hypothetical protein [Candidatus Aminicenantes bacterium]
MKKKKGEEDLIGENKAPKCQLTGLPDIEHSTIKEKQKLIFRIKLKLKRSLGLNRWRKLKKK